MDEESVGVGSVDFILLREEGERRMSREQPCYHLPLGAMIETMLWCHQAMLLTSRLSVIPGLPREDYRIHLVLQQGKVLSCTISTATGLTLQGERALEAIQDCGALSWHLSAPPSPPAVEPATALPQGFRPRRSIEIPSVQTASGLSHLERQIFLLTDGKRSIAHIAALVGRSPQEVQKVLLKLAEHHLIVFDE